MNAKPEFTDLTAQRAEVLADGRFVILGQDDVDLGALAPGLQIVGLPDNDVVVVGAFSLELATQVTRPDDEFSGKPYFPW